MSDPAKTTAVDDARNPIPPELRWLDGLDNELIDRVLSVEAQLRQAKEEDAILRAGLEQRWKDFKAQADLAASLQAQLRQEREANRRLTSDFNILVQENRQQSAQVAQLQATVGQLRESVTAYRSAHPGCGRNGYDKCDYCEMADAALATCPAPEEEHE